MSEQQKLRIEEVAVLVGTSTQTLNNWYRWKKLHPDHELAKLLPDYEQLGKKQVRYWDKSAVWKLTEFKNVLPHGKNGILGDVTQRRYRESRANKN